MHNDRLNYHCGHIPAIRASHNMNDSAAWLRYDRLSVIPPQGVSQQVRQIVTAL
jgi:hypothetical protein